MKKSFYSETISNFLVQSTNEILGIICSNDISASTIKQQSKAWEQEIKILKNQLKSLTEGRIIFEYSIPRMGKRVDVIILHQNIVFILEFKCGSKVYHTHTYDQVYDYALDIRNFQQESHDKLLVPIMVETEAESKSIKIEEFDHIIKPLRCNKNNIATAIETVTKQFPKKSFDYLVWEKAAYMPTPTIIEAAQALYAKHGVEEITHHGAGVHNLSTTTDAISRIIENSKVNGEKSICFVTGVPGAGKTLVGLNIAIKYSHQLENNNAIFLSGNYPLVTVLREALMRDSVKQQKNNNEDDTEHNNKSAALRKISTFIQIVHQFHNDLLDVNLIPREHIVIFDEAQRAWNSDKIAQFMKRKKSINDFQYSEPEFLISTMDRRQDWAVIICLVGGGQEINTGEAGLPEWFKALRKRFSKWNVYITEELNDSEYLLGHNWHDMLRGLHVIINPVLHLSTSTRTFRASKLSAFVKALLDGDTDEAHRLLASFKDKYPIVITRDLKKAKSWVLQHCPDKRTRCGILASSGSIRLKSEGIYVKNNLSVANWFLDNKEDVRSSNMLEDVVTEFDIQGLEIDYSIVAWDANLRYENNEWTYYHFKGTSWDHVHNNDRKLYLKNAYRVLLTRARQGMVIFIPPGSDDDNTRKREWYDKIYEYLNCVGIEEL